jgi:hypothetical protein
MSTEIYKITEDLKMLEQQPTMKKPVFKKGPDAFDRILNYKLAQQEYKKHLASLKKYPAEGFTEDYLDEDLKEGINFETSLEILVEINVDMGAGWEKAIPSEYDNADPKYRRIIACPLPFDERDKEHEYYEATKNLSCAICGYFCNNPHHVSNWFEVTQLERDDEFLKALPNAIYLRGNDFNAIKSDFQKWQSAQSKSAQEDFLTVARQWQQWSIQAFPKATSVISLKKLRAELNELIEEIECDTPSPLQDEGIPLLEFADCFMCLLHSAAREGFSPEQITRAIKNKALINKERKWKENPDSTYSHIK